MMAGDELRRGTGSFVLSGSSMARALELRRSSAFTTPLDFAVVIYGEVHVLKTPEAKRYLACL